MGKTSYAVCHLQRGGSNGSGLSCHIERQTTEGKVFVPLNADASRTHLNRELITFPEGIHNRSQAIQHRVEHAGLTRKVGKNQTTHICIILSGTHEQMMKLQEEGRLDEWCKANLVWLNKQFGKENVVSCVLHRDEKTPHLHATVVPILKEKRTRRAREGEKKYNVDHSGPRLSCSDVMTRVKLRKYQDTYGAAMAPFGLERGIVGSLAKHKSSDQYAKQRMEELQTDLDKLMEEVEKAKEGKSFIFGLFGKGNLADAKKTIKQKDEEIAKLKQQLADAKASLAAEKKAHAKDVFDIQKLCDNMAKERDAAIKTARQYQTRCERLEDEKKELHRKAYPERYRLSSGAELVHTFIANPMHPSLHIWTRVADAVYDTISFDIPHGTYSRYEKGELTDEELTNDVFPPEEQVNDRQIELLEAAIIAASGGPAQAHVGTGGGGGDSKLPWRDRKKDKGSSRSL